LKYRRLVNTGVWHCGADDPRSLIRRVAPAQAQPKVGFMQHQLEPPAQTALASGHMVEELHVVLRGLRRGWYYIAISAVVCLALGLVYALRATTSYQATARLLILEQGGRLLPGPNGVPFQGGGGNEGSLSTHIHIMRSPTVAAVAAKAVEDAGVKGLTTGSLIDHLTVTIPDSTAKVLQLVYTAGTKEEAQKVIDAVIASYETFLEDNYQENNDKTVEKFIHARNGLSTEIAEMESKYLEYREKNPSYTTGEDGRPPARRRLAQLEGEANQVRLQKFRLELELELAEERIRRRERQRIAKNPRMTMRRDFRPVLHYFRKMSEWSNDRASELNRIQVQVFLTAK